MRRPVLVIQANPFNESRMATVIVAIITSNLGLADLPGNVRLAKAESGLPKPSVVNVSQLLTIDRSLLVERVKTLTASSVQRIDEGVRLVLAL
ncbi:MAG: type II toxin-antitoxin system PemK/MazF family toxin [Pseudomonadota bacterium]